jgi:PleD family two-component response regulator
MTVSFLIGCWRKVSRRRTKRRRKSFAAGFISTSPDCRRRPRNSTIFSTPHSALESLVHKLSEPTRITEEFDAYAPDLVITDIKMPEMDGIELVERLRSHLSRDMCLPILVLTGSPEPRHKRRALAVGATDIISKPFDSAENQMRIRNLLEIRFQLSSRSI